MILGPYTRERALELAEKFNAWLERKGEDWRTENYEFIHAGAIPIQKVGIRGMIEIFDH